MKNGVCRLFLRTPFFSMLIYYCRFTLVATTKYPIRQQ